jgi:dTDP-D-glucose 4,6-dehydratase
MVAVAWHSFLLLEFKDTHPGHDDRYKVALTLPQLGWDDETLARHGVRRIEEGEG